MVMAWTEERVESLKRLWAEGLSASQIAVRLGDVSRNAVIGKVHRLGLAGRATTSRVKTVRPRKAIARTKRPRSLRFAGIGGGVREGGFGHPALQPVGEQPRQYEELVIPLEQRKTIQTLTQSSCRWPIGDPQAEDFHFCGHDRISGLPYCEFHARRAFQPVQQRRREVREPQHKIIALGGGG
jgi:GcrA cell cycle regulator